MKITVKNLQQQTFVVEIDENQTVVSLKEEIQKLKGAEYEVERQKLIYAGIILEDDREISSYNMDEKKFVVVMVKRDLGNVNSKNDKPKISEEITSSSNKTNESSTESQKSLEKPDTISLTQDDSGDTNETQQAAASEAQHPSSGDLERVASMQIQAESNLLVGQEYEKTVQSIVEMGYSKEMVERAMVASFNNPERAVEYLISGIPEIMAEVAAEPLAAVESTSGSSEAVQRDLPNVPPTNSSENPFEFLRNQPQFLQMRSLIHQNPDLLHSVLQQIGQTNPALLQLIYENQEAFLNMLNQPLDGSSSANPITTAMLPNFSNIGQNMPGSNSAASGETNQGSAETAVNRSNEQGESNSRSGMTTIRLSPQDQEAVERLKALGFPEVLVLQAYFACEKNEQLAANFLLSSHFDD